MASISAFHRISIGFIENPLYLDAHPRNSRIEKRDSFSLAYRGTFWPCKLIVGYCSSQWLEGVGGTEGKTRNIDLILTEVDLPGISGFALLVLIMKHEICKNSFS